MSSSDRRYRTRLVYRFFFNDTATTEIYTYGHTLSLHDALPSSSPYNHGARGDVGKAAFVARPTAVEQVSRLLAYCWMERIHLVPQGANTGLVKGRSEEHTSELQSLMRISYAVFCLKKKTQLATY